MSFGIQCFSLDQNNANFPMVGIMPASNAGTTQAVLHSEFRYSVFSLEQNNANFPMVGIMPASNAGTTQLVSLSVFSL